MISKDNELAKSQFTHQCILFSDITGWEIDWGMAGRIFSSQTGAKKLTSFIATSIRRLGPDFRRVSSARWSKQRAETMMLQRLRAWPRRCSIRTTPQASPTVYRTRRRL